MVVHECLQHYVEPLFGLSDNVVRHNSGALKPLDEVNDPTAARIPNMLDLHGLAIEQLASRNSHPPSGGVARSRPSSPRTRRSESHCGSVAITPGAFPGWLHAAFVETICEAAVSRRRSSARPALRFV